LEERIDLVVEEARRHDGVGIAIGVSLVLHVLFIIYVARTYKPVGNEKVATPILHYVELMRQNRDFTEAPGQKQKTASIDAPLSDANRKASAPERTGDKPTIRPGDGGKIWSPPAGQHAAQQQSAAPSPSMAQSAPPTANAEAPPTNPAVNAMTFRQPVSQASASGIDWHGAIREIGKVASLGGPDQIDHGNGGGDKGFAENGPISFESQWFDWGEYAEGMVRRIRVNWLSIMPAQINDGIKGHLYIRMTIHRDGRISDIEFLQKSGVPPYDMAAQKALEMSSPIAPLPKKFPDDTERVTFGFFYNEQPPTK